MANKQRVIIGNIALTGFVNFVSEDGSRFVLGTGKFTAKGATEPTYKESVTVFLDSGYDGIKPAKNDYVAVSNVDLVVSERKDKEGELQSSINVRFANQVEKREAPVKKEAAASSDI